MAVAIGNVEVYLEYGGDFVLTEQGDLKLAIDVRDDGLATKQRLERLIMQSPTLRDVRGSAIARADDIFNPEVGAGGRRSVGSMITPELINQMKSQIAAGIESDPNIASIPAPEISVSDAGNGYLLIGPVKVVTLGGQPVTVPAQPLKVQ